MGEFFFFLERKENLFAHFSKKVKKKKALSRLRSRSFTQIRFFFPNTRWVEREITRLSSVSASVSVMPYHIEVSPPFCLEIKPK
jgi:hypothetical protein